MLYYSYHSQRRPGDRIYDVKHQTKFYTIHISKSKVDTIWLWNFCVAIWLVSHFIRADFRWIAHISVLCTWYIHDKQIHDVVIWAVQRNSWANCCLSKYLGIVPKKFPILSMSTLFNKISRKRFFSVVFVTKIKYKVCEIVLISLLKLSNKPEHRKWKQKNVRLWWRLNFYEVVCNWTFTFMC